MITGSRGRRLAGCAVVAVSAFALTGCGSSHATAAARPAATGVTVTGVLKLSDSYALVGQGTGCKGTDGYDDMTQGTEVVVQDQDGATVGLGALNSGALTADGLACDFAFRVAVPVRKFYVIRTGNRQGPTFSLADVESGPVALTIGN